MEIKHRLWAADPHQWGPGKVHILDDTKSDRTYCGKRPSAFPGKTVEIGRSNCQLCANAVVTRTERAREKRERSEAKRAERDKRDREKKEQYEVQRLQRSIQREAERIQRVQEYNSYLNSDKWRQKRAAVLRRAAGVCEGCGFAGAVEVHHKTYEHIFDEPLFDLVAICRKCHERVTEMDRARRGR